MNLPASIARELGRDLSLYTAAKQPSGISPAVARALGSRLFAGFQPAPAGSMRVPAAALPRTGAALSGATATQSGATRSEGSASVGDTTQLSSLASSAAAI